MNINKMKKLKKRIKTWKVWFSKSMFGFDDYEDIFTADLATSDEPQPDAIIYGLDVSDALRRYIAKRPWKDLCFNMTDGDTFARVAVLPNHGMHRTSCPWALNLPRHIQFWK